jgi:membrane fusion protein, macrolide-specific efflux system
MVRTVWARKIWTRIRRRPTPVINTGLGVLLLVCAGLGYATVKAGAGTAAGSSAGTSSTARVVSASQGTVTDSVSATGTVESASTAGASFVTSGTVTEIDVKVGDLVQQGQILAKVDAVAARDQVTVAKANLTSATASLTAAQSASTVDSNTVSAAQAQVTNAQKAVDSAQAALDGTVLVAPMAGTVTAVNGTVGSSAGSGSSGSSSTSGSSGSSGSSQSTPQSTASGFIELADLAKLAVNASFAEADATKLKVGQAATIEWTAPSGGEATGEVATVAPEATTQNNVNTYPVTVSLDTVPDGARIGQTTTVRVTVGEAENAVRVPAGAVHGTATAHTVEVVTAAGSHETRTVQVGVQGSTWVEITSGLQVGEQVVVTRSTGSTGNGNSNGVTSGGGPGGLTGGGLTGVPPGGGPGGGAGG